MLMQSGVAAEKILASKFAKITIVSWRPTLSGTIEIAPNLVRIQSFSLLLKLQAVVIEFETQKSGAAPPARLARLSPH
jgi:hypothetical protein